MLRSLKRLGDLAILKVAGRPDADLARRFGQGRLDRGTASSRGPSRSSWRRNAAQAMDQGDVKNLTRKLRRSSPFFGCDPRPAGAGHGAAWPVRPWAGGAGAPDWLHRTSRQVPRDRRRARFAEIKRKLKRWHGEKSMATIRKGNAKDRSRLRLSASLHQTL